MPRTETPAGITLAYDTFGSPADPALLLVMGFGAQLIAWPPGLCERLAAPGRFVIRFDNRDCGLSTKFDGEAADAGAIAAAAAPYTLSALSDDAFGLLTALGIERAHVVGASMGGMIAQTMAIEHPERLLTLTSMMSSTGEPEYGQSTPEALAALLEPSPSDRAGYVKASRRAAIWRSKQYPELAEAEELAGESYDRCYYPEGVNRQLAAMIASGSRADGLRALAVPTLVIHGLEDTLIAPSGGERTAALIPDAQLLLLDGMGHDRPPPLWPTICDAILERTSADAVSRRSDLSAVRNGRYVTEKNSGDI
jgi:pimeloyl-ACP methyl ester carboxylesterase